MISNRQTNWLQREWALTVSGELHRRLEAPRTLGPLRAKNWLEGHQLGWAVSGYWKLRSHGEDYRTRIWLMVEIPWHWFFDPPQVRTEAPFIRRLEDWHVNSDGSLCHILADQWAFQFGEWLGQNTPISRLVDSAATWTLAATDSLITRHLHASTSGLVNWPRSWADWSHGDAGVRQFREELKRQKASA